MENQRLFKVFYSGKQMCWVIAHTKFEAVDKAYYKFYSEETPLDRKLIRAFIVH